MMVLFYSCFLCNFSGNICCNIHTHYFTFTPTCDGASGVGVFTGSIKFSTVVKIVDADAKGLYTSVFEAFFL